MLSKFYSDSIGDKNWWFLHLILFIFITIYILLLYIFIDYKNYTFLSFISQMIFPLIVFSRIIGDIIHLNKNNDYNENRLLFLVVFIHLISFAIPGVIIFKLCTTLK